MYSVRSDLSKNRLYIKLSGHMEKSEVAMAADKVIEEAKKLRPGFATINDISDFKPASQDATTELQRAQAFLKQAGTSRVIRILGESTIANLQLNRTGGYKADTADSIAEADRLLDA